MSLELPSGLNPQSQAQDASFFELLRRHDLEPAWDVGAGDGRFVRAPEATTILALRYADGVVMVGDRRATEGHTIAHRRMQKVYPADGYSAVAIAGTAGLAMEMVKLFQTELEHYEKLEGTRLSLEGKANHLARMVRQQLPMVFQGLVVVPLFCGFDEEAGEGRLYTYDVVGGRYEEDDYAASGSGGREAKAYLRSVFRDDLSEDDALRHGIAAIAAAAEQDTATGGPDPRRGIYSSAVIVDRAGYREVDEDRVATVSNQVMGDDQ
ncbi:MAG: proteasome subunit beta [Acidimicrobiia bacterium]|nr:proteasome subunit beta [Acidimicrobiia bacterium]MBT8217220.1 proteasome subunit beta [Acidimicrobiia bacterium]NNF10217.1 proteasome subunit beta [Acidimicrobiia bacterium]NNL69289.1 proteasome subunit beta [Acidimicrobiia bacterium]